jgi:hypothetical protein
MTHSCFAHGQWLQKVIGILVAAAHAAVAAIVVGVAIESTHGKHVTVVNIQSSVAQSATQQIPRREYRRFNVNGNEKIPLNLPDSHTRIFLKGGTETRGKIMEASTQKKGELE